jgi:glyoxylase-like metal-dependent hydrolase (beta-lactamase superfamily II)
VSLASVPRRRLVLGAAGAATYGARAWWSLEYRIRRAEVPLYSETVAFLSPGGRELVPAGHTDSDCLVFFTKSNVVHMGDQFFNGRFPNIDLGGGGTIRGYIRNVEHAIETIPQGAKIIPGHGPVGGIDELKKFHQMLLATSAVVEKQIAAGKTFEQVKAEGLPAEWKEWATSMPEDRWLDILYRGLSAKPPATPAAPAAAPKAA